MHSLSLATGIALWAVQAEVHQAPPRPPLRVTEQASQESFPLERRFLDARLPKLQAVGVYLRIRDGVKLYALCLYVDVPGLLALTRDGNRSPDRLASLLVEGRVAHAFVSRFVDAIPRENRLGFLKGNLAKAWVGTFEPEAPEVQRFMAFFDRDLPRGSETQVWIDAQGSLHTREKGGKSTATTAPALARAWTAAYLGAQPMDEGMKLDLLRELPDVMGLEEMVARPVRATRR